MNNFDFIELDKAQAARNNSDDKPSRLAKWRHFIHHTLQEEGVNRLQLQEQLALLDAAREQIHARLEALEGRPELSPQVANLQNAVRSIQEDLKGTRGPENLALSPSPFKPDWGENSIHGEGKSTRDYDVLAYAVWWLEVVHIPAIKSKQRGIEEQLNLIEGYLASRKVWGFVASDSESEDGDSLNEDSIDPRWRETMDMPFNEAIEYFLKQEGAFDEGL